MLSVFGSRYDPVSDTGEVEDRKAKVSGPFLKFGCECAVFLALQDVKDQTGNGCAPPLFVGISWR